MSKDKAILNRDLIMDLRFKNLETNFYSTKYFYASGSRTKDIDIISELL